MGMTTQKLAEVWRADLRLAALAGVAPEALVEGLGRAVAVAGCLPPLALVNDLAGVVRATQLGHRPAALAGRSFSMNERHVALILAAAAACARALQLGAAVPGSDAELVRDVSLALIRGGAGWLKTEGARPPCLAELERSRAGRHRAALRRLERVLTRLPRLIVPLPDWGTTPSPQVGLEAALSAQQTVDVHFEGRLDWPIEAHPGGWRGLVTQAVQAAQRSLVIRGRPPLRALVVSERPWPRAEAALKAWLHVGVAANKTTSRAALDACVLPASRRVAADEPAALARLTTLLMEVL